MTKTNIPLLFLGVCVLLLASYTDNVRGPLIPIFVERLHIGYDQSSWLIISGHLSGFLMTLALIPLLNYVSLPKVTIGIAGFAILTHLYSEQVADFTSFIIFGALLGGVISMLGAMCNIIAIEATPTQIQNRSLSAIHAMYGAGSFIGSLAVGFCIKNELGWTAVFKGVVVAYIFIGVFAFFLQKKKPSL